MKRVKVMLIAIGILSVVGGALAFKAKKFGSDDYCVRANDLGTLCTTFVTDSEFVGSGIHNFKYLITTNTFNCDDGHLLCFNSGRRIM